MRGLVLAVCTLFCLACGTRSRPDLWIWVPGGGGQAERIEALAKELGLQARMVTGRDLLATPLADLQRVRALVVFEGSGTEMLGATGVKEVLKAGGTLALVGDSPSFLEGPVGFKVASEGPSPLVWEAPARPHLAPGTFQPRTGRAVVYSYGDQILGGWHYLGLKGEVWATSSTGHLRWVEQAWGGGHLVFAGLPLAGYAAQSNSQGARMLLERVADLARLPRLWPTPGGLGGIAVNVHVDSQAHLPYLPDLVARWPKEVRASWHLTAGPDLEREGDGLGLNVADGAKGGAWVARLLELGEVGSHGGWIHNLWASQAGRWPTERLQHLVHQNMQALAARGAAAKSYSSPVGLHPQALNPWLEDHGIRAAYYTGEAGSPPTRPWVEGRPWSRKVWAFPLATEGKAASAFEFRARGEQDEEVALWLRSLLDYCERTHSLRLVYGHPTEWAYFPQGYHGLVQALALGVQRGALSAWTLSDYAAFLDRHQDTTWSFQADGDRARLVAAGSSLQGMAFRVPGDWRLAGAQGVRSWSEGGWTWIVIQDPIARFEGRLVR